MPSRKCRSHDIPGAFEVMTQQAMRSIGWRLSGFRSERLPTSPGRSRNAYRGFSRREWKVIGIRDRRTVLHGHKARAQASRQQRACSSQDPQCGDGLIIVCFASANE